MTFNKNKGVSVVAAMILLVVFSAIAFLVPVQHNLIFWLGYSFAVFATILLSAMFVFLFDSKDNEERFFKLAHVKLAWVYFVIQIALSIWQMFFYSQGYFLALILDCIVTAVFLIIILVVHAGTQTIDKKEQKTAQKVLFIRELQNKVSLISSNESDVSKRLKDLAETIRFSDPMSHSRLFELEEEILQNISLLEKCVGIKEEAEELLDKIEKQLKERAMQCKTLKGVKDVEVALDNSGVKYVGTAFGILAGMATIVLVVCFVVIPTQKYNAAKTLLDLEKYPEAIVAFEALGDYRDSEMQIEVAQNAILQQKYDDALALLENGKYEEAIIAFTEIRDYKDSTDKIKKAETIIKQNNYDAAEEYFNDGKYSEAINIYSSLGDFKDSKLRIEQIYNRLSDGDIIYFGTYNNSPIAWKILKTESDKMLLITEKPIAQKPFNDTIKKVTWENSSLRTWLNEEFMTNFSAEQQNQILSTDTGDTSEKVFLLSVDEMVELAKTVTFKTSEEWWTRTATDDGIMYTAPTGWVKAEGDQVVRDKGVRPSIWISLE